MNDNYELIFQELIDTNILKISEDDLNSSNITLEFVFNVYNNNNITIHITVNNYDDNITISNVNVDEKIRGQGYLKNYLFFCMRIAYRYLLEEKNNTLNHYTGNVDINVFDPDTMFEKAYESYTEAFRQIGLTPKYEVGDKNYTEIYFINDPEIEIYDHNFLIPTYADRFWVTGGTRETSIKRKGNENRDGLKKPRTKLRFN